MNNQELREIIKESVREVLKEERLALYEILTPYATQKERDDIQKRFGSPEKYDEDQFVDMTDWIKE
ncbi:hypothetical protein GWO43_09530 [candidate division KSB1 bacterium]|nr:hypothetical protein [candidate division KSB1 bacterium]NIR69409.1 hypothetical protein [candidate division KSB1 bacterium]NIS24207.1 hypothetical protein [candidate division KSB1 bacterium]NIT71121.1 hypothetical protein [candidate division KSB1 bacterium]NIU24826.1 hypothetical protein [candidate division KSB1 bacterium]